MYDDTSVNPMPENTARRRSIVMRWPPTLMPRSRATYRAIATGRARAPAYSGPWVHAVASGVMQWPAGPCSGQWVHAVARGFMQWPAGSCRGLARVFIFSQSFVSQNTSTVGGLAIVDQRQRPRHQGDLTPGEHAAAGRRSRIVDDAAVGDVRMCPLSGTQWTCNIRGT
jgi:hypothetical protein